MFSPNDLKLFQFIRAAMDFKFKPGNWEKESFHGIKFDPYINFWTQKLVSARKLPEKYKDIFKDRKIFEETYKDLAFKKELQFLNNPYVLKDIPEEQGLPGEVHDQITQEAQSISPEAISEVYPSETAPMSATSTPHLPTMSPSQAQTSKTAVLEKTDEVQGADRTENMESATEKAQHPNPPSSPRQEVPQAFEKAFENEPEHTLDPAVKNAPVPPTKTVPEVKPTEKITSQITQGAQSTPSGFTSGFKNISSRTQIFFKRNFGGLGNIFKNAASRGGVFFQRNFGKFATLGNLGTLASGFIGGVVGGGLAAGNPFGIAAGMGGGVGFRHWVSGGGAGPTLSRLGNGIINAGSRFSNLISGPKTTTLKNTMGKRVLFLVFGFLMLSVGIGSIFAPSDPSQTPTGVGGGGIIAGGTCPDTSTNRASCRYLNPSINLFQSSLSSTDLEAYINKYSSVFINAGKGDLTEFRQRVNYIVNNSQSVGLNPALFLGYWKSESNFSTVGSRDMGCVGEGFYEQVDCALGIKGFSDPNKNPIANCAKSRDANSAACTALKSIRKTLDINHPVKYPLATIDDFAESYGPFVDFTAGAPTNCSHTYNTLIEVAKELNSCTTSTLPATAGQNTLTTTASQITQTLSIGIDRFYNVKQNEPGVYYWCTYLIVDSYNKAGYTGLTRSAHALVLNMKSFFANSAGLKLLAAETPVTQLKPGDVIFFEGSGDQHVSMVKSIDLDQLGNGAIKTYESNNVVTEDTVFVKEFKAIKAQTTVNKYSITGFGTTQP